MPNINSKSQQAKTQLGGSEEPTINNFYENDSILFWMVKPGQPNIKMHSTYREGITQDKYMYF